MTGIEVQRRAQAHAALGDPLRLAVVDRLRLGDASPGELAASFGTPTNLLAHHLRVLEVAGLIRRVRSEGDGRRSYVQLGPDPAPLTTSYAETPGLRAPRVVFVCTHNSARSQLAAAAWTRAHTVPGLSAGTHPAPRVHPRTFSVGRRHGLRLGPARPTDVAQVRRPGDLVVAVCDNAYEELGDVALHWSVSDPVRIDTNDAFERAYRQIATRVERLAAAVEPGPAAPSGERETGRW